MAEGAERDPLDVIAEQALFSECARDDLAQLAASSELRRVEAGSTVVAEGDAAQSFFVLCTGTVTIERTGGDGRQHQLAALTAPAHFGESSLMGASLRAATVRAETTIDLIELDVERMLELARTRPGFTTVLLKLLAETFAHLKRSSDMSVEVLDRALQESRMRMRIGRFVMLTILGLTGYTVFLGLVGSAKELAIKSEFITVPMLATTSVLIVWFMKTSGFSASFFGLTLRNWKRNTFEALALTTPLMFLTVLVKMWLIRSTDAPLFDITAGDGAFNPALIAAYVLFVPAQELTCRGGVQSSLSAFLVSPRKRIEAIVGANAVFLVAHLYISLSLSVIAFVCGMFWGWLYERQESLVGPVVSHIILGLWAFEFVGMPGIQ